MKLNYILDILTWISGLVIFVLVIIVIIKFFNTFL